ncbi:2,3-bisphosphoglycerate-independent phosphoglycerate mutase [Candidatus Dojkabacteria bacterium]|nr:2,3-bisphosphoglycerate-independent phosphoglycerate mutase [Candidatus Dojkabacteria bacterium]
MTNQPKPIVLIVLDGLGVAPPNPGNAVTQAKTPNLDNFWFKYPHCFLQASGTNVGLPSGVNGNSEVGHMGLGAGKVIFQEIARIDHEMETGIFYKNPTFTEAAQHVKNSGGKVHLMGLTSPGKVHSSMDHLYACVEFCKKSGLKNVFIHAFTDGRDVPPKSAEKYLSELEKKTGKSAKIASVIGRYFAMDRDERWERTQQAYDLIAYGKGTQVGDWKEALDSSYNQGDTDEYVKSYVIAKDGSPIATVTPGDAVIFFNYRADRAVQLAKAFEEENFSGWQKERIENVFFAGFSNYEKGMVMNRADEDTALPGGESEMVQKLFQEEMQKTDTGFPAKQIFPPEKVEYSLGRLISDAGLKQLRLTESEKFPHVTYFFNCRTKNPFTGEDRLEIPSPKEVKTYDEKPEMSSYEITDTLLKKIEEGVYDFILVNYASTDMVAHTGKLEASIKASEVVDECLGKIAAAVLAKGGEMLVTADHGNVEELVNLQTGEVDTEHSTNPVPFLYVSNNYETRELTTGILADIAPTVLAALGIQVPQTMTGRDLMM